MTTYKDNRGYERYDKEHTDLVHRNRIYHVYLENRDKYPLPFSAYEVHHKDFDKTNNKVSNLMIVTPTEHDKIHSEERKRRIKEAEKQEIEEREMRRINAEIMLETSKTNIALDKKIEKARKEKAKQKKKRFVAVSFVVMVIILLLLIFYTPKSLFTEKTQNTLPEVKQEAQQIDKPFVVDGSKTDVIIKNNQDRSISLEVTYRIYSNWFGADYQESKVFDVEPKTQKSFKVYNNDGCLTAPCSVSIISFKER